MAKLKLVIADMDQAYVRALAAYLNSCRLAAFNISCFTKTDAFISYMEQEPAVDVLLIGAEFYGISTGCPDIGVKLMLSESTTEGNFPGFHKVNRFNTGEKLAGELIHLYSKLNASEQEFVPGMKDTGFIAVYSPTGGAGKTSIAAAMAIHSSRMGMKILYLNLETIGTTTMLFSGDNRRNLSYVFYYLKEKSGNLPMLLEGIKCTDADNGVDFFYPPESPMEYGELDPSDMEQLFQGIRAMNCYDYVLIDMHSGLDRNNHKIMSLCDYVILVELPEPVSRIKKQMLLKELDKLDSAIASNLSERLVTVVNRDKTNTGGICGDPAGYSNNAIRIPEYSRTLIKENGCVTIDDESFWIAVNQLIRWISHKRGNANG